MVENWGGWLHPCYVSIVAQWPWATQGKASRARSILFFLQEEVNLFTDVNNCLLLVILTKGSPDILVKIRQDTRYPFSINLLRHQTIEKVVIDGLVNDEIEDGLSENGHFYETVGS